MDFNAILAMLRNGQAQQARTSLEAARTAGEDTAPVNGLLARACLALGDRAGARAAIDAGLARDRRFAPLWLELAMLERTEGNAEAFVSALRQAYLLMPTQHSVGLDLARALVSADELEEADVVLTRICEQAPQTVAAWAMRGQLALKFGNARAAEESFVHAQRLAPNDQTILRGLADAAAMAGKAQGELWARERVVALAPTDAIAHAELADALRRDDRPEAARTQFDKAMLRAPGELQLEWLRLNTLPIVVPDEATQMRLRSEWDDDISALAQRLEDSPPSRELALRVLPSTTNFYRHYLGEPLVDAQRNYGRALQALARAAFPGMHECVRPPDRARRRVALVSSHFHAHTIWKLFRSWCEALRTRCELVLVHLDKYEDAATIEARGLAAHFVPAQPDIRQTVERMRELAPDAIVYLDAAMHPHGQALAALRLAPLQCATWGHPVTTGLPTIDRFLSSDAMEPEDGQRHYTERLVRLPGLGLSFIPAGTPGATSTLAAQGVRYLFCAQSAQKLTPAHDALFADLLQACPAHSLALVPHDKPHVRDALAARIRRRLSEQGIDPARLVVLPAVNHADFLALARDADLVVDSLGWSGGMTTMDALSVGTPVVTVPGETMRSRHTAALLAMIGRGEWTGADTRSFPGLVARVAGEPGAIAPADLARHASDAFGRAPWTSELVEALADSGD